MTIYLIQALEFAIYFGVIVLLIYLRRTTRPSVVEPNLTHAAESVQQELDEPSCHSSRTVGSLFSGAYESIAQRLKRYDRQNRLILAAGINFIDLSVHLIQQKELNCHHREGMLYLA